jgi:hypothetical protein
MYKRRVIISLAAVALFSMLSVMTSLAGMEVGLYRNVVLAAVSVVVVSVATRFALHSQDRVQA